MKTKPETPTERLERLYREEESVTPKTDTEKLEHEMRLKNIAFLLDLAKERLS